MTNHKNKKAIFIFRRDLRLEDNTGLIKCLEESEKVLPVFIFDPRQISWQKNPYFSKNAFQFMIESLRDLDKSLRERNSKLYILEGKPDEVIKSLIKKDKFKTVCCNEDYTPFSRKRDSAIKKVCDDSGADFIQHQDYTLSPIKEIKTNQNTKYKVFTPFYKKALEYEVNKPEKNNHNNLFKGKISLKTFNVSKYEKFNNKNIFRNGGRTNALKLFKETDFLKKYNKDRNFPAIEGTSGLSPHHKFGTVSIRETYYWAKKNKAVKQFISELYWRDFYMYIAYHFPEVFGKSFLKWGDRIKWLNNEKDFDAWCRGETGVPIVDAGMRQLNETGWMHNRVRMIVASYLTKNLLIDWRWGEEYFASKLVDYDSSSNNGGWQWAASVGADPKPVRIFNPYSQTKEYDPKAEYIKRWISELKKVDSDFLTDGKEHDFSEIAKYPKPIVDQKTSYHRAKEAYKKAIKSKAKTK